MSYTMSDPLLLLAIQVGVEVVTEGLGRVAESQLLVNGSDLLDVFRVELEVTLQVCLYPRGSLGFWKDGVALRNTPCQSHLCSGLVVLLANLDKSWVILGRDAISNAK